MPGASGRGGKGSRQAAGGAHKKKQVPKRKAQSKKAPKRRGASATPPAGGATRGPALDGQMVYSFGASRTDGHEGMKQLLGGKGANLAEMTRVGLPVPPGFTITTEVCAAYHAGDRKFPSGLMREVHARLSILESEMGKRFGHGSDPLLVSVRSGAAASMPGMMDTILNLGLTDASVDGLAARTHNPRFAYDAYRRLINMFGDVVMGVEHKRFEREFERVKHDFHARTDTDVPVEGMIELCDRYKRVYRKHCGHPFPQDPEEQLAHAIEAVFASWENPRAITYRRINGITGLKGTAVNVQAMAYGNTGDTSGTGVAFTRNPSTGKNEFFGEFLINAQGEDVVAGIRTPKPVKELRRWNREVYEQLLEIKKTLEHHYRDMQDIEFTIEEGRLFMLQTRTGKRTARAALKIAFDLVEEGLIDEDEALLRIPAGDLTQLLLPSFSAASKKQARVIAKGLPASPGAAVGQAAFTAEEAVARAQKGDRLILVRAETSPEDVEGMHSAVGILTSTGGMTSHAAVVARGWGKCCVVGAGAISIDEKAGKFTIDGKTYGRDTVLSVDGNTGEVMLGEVEAPPPKMSGEFARVMEWADRNRGLGIRANADTPDDARRAREFGAEGIGLCRTEHMFFEGQRIIAMRRMILAETRADREQALARLLPYQREDFEGIFRAMKGLPVTIRLLDPPLHEFLPNDRKSVAQMAKELGLPVRRVEQRVMLLNESNPMLGHRGCRLAVTYPEILQMQVRAIVEAAIACSKKRIKAIPEIMIPLVGAPEELAVLRDLAEQTIARTRDEAGYTRPLDIRIGTMMEVPRACVAADRIAEHANFFSFGTNDLTQLVFGYSRDDVNGFLPDYLSKEILPADPFQTLDRAGVGDLIELALERGRGTKPDLKIGICGEHGGDPASIEFCHEHRLDYVSCSPFRVPIARLASAQAALRASRGG